MATRHHCAIFTLPDIAIFLKFGLVKLRKSLHNVDNANKNIWVHEHPSVLNSDLN